MAEKQATLWLKIKTTGEQALTSIGEGLDKLGATAMRVAQVGLAAFSAAIAFSVKKAKDKEDALRQLDQALVNNGLYTRALADDYKKQADALSQVSLYEDDQILKAQALVQQQIGQQKITKELTRSILDFAQAQGMDLNSAADLVGKTIGSQTNALGRYGIEVNATASKTEKMTQVMAGLNAKFGGQAEAATQGLGSIGMLRKSIEDLFGKVGEKIAPGIGYIVKSLQDISNNSENASGAVGFITEAFYNLTKAGIIVKNAIALTWNTILGGIGTIAVALGQLMDRQFSKAWDTIKNRWSDGQQYVKQVQQQTHEELNALDQSRTEAHRLELDKQVQNEVRAAELKKEVKTREDSEENARALERQITQEQINQGLIVNEEQLAMARLEINKRMLDEKIKLATSAGEKEKLLQQKLENEKLITAKKQDDLQIANRKETLGTIAGLSSSSNKTLAGIGKAAALTQLAIDTPVAVGKAFASAPPPFNYILAAGVAAAMAAQAAKVAGVQLAEGGIVMPRPGGIQATIGEAGQAEAVIPLDRAGEFGLGGGGSNVTINVFGGILGDQSSAREFAVAVDRELYKLRKNNESVSFEGIVI